MSQTVIEIQTMEGGRLEWVAIMSSSSRAEAFRWADAMKDAWYPHGLKPNLRCTDGLYGPVTGAWQAEGYDGDD